MSAGDLQQFSIIRLAGRFYVLCMPGALRHESAGAGYHVMCRGNNGQSIFRRVVRAAFVRSRRVPLKKTAVGGCFFTTLEEGCQQTGWRVHAYVLMDNHDHFLLETPEANLAAGMK